jgi:hypothetical protein
MSKTILEDQQWGIEAEIQAFGFINLDLLYKAPG